MENLEMNREEMKNRLIRALSLEHPAVVEFFRLCEEYEDNAWNNRCLFGMFEALLDLVQYASELE